MTDFVPLWHGSVRRGDSRIEMLDARQPAKRLKKSHPTDNVLKDAEEESVTLRRHPLGVKPSGNAYTATEDLKDRCGDFRRLPDELIITLLEYLDASALIKLGSTCKALYAFSRAEELWKALFVR